MNSDCVGKYEQKTMRQFKKTLNQYAMSLDILKNGEFFMTSIVSNTPSYKTLQVLTIT